MGITKKRPLRMGSASGFVDWDDIQVNPYPMFQSGYSRVYYASGSIGYPSLPSGDVQRGYEDFEKQRLEQQLRETQAELDRVRGVVEVPDPEKKRPVRLIVLPKEE